MDSSEMIFDDFLGHVRHRAARFSPSFCRPPELEREAGSTNLEFDGDSWLTRPGKRRNSLRHRSHGPVEIVVGYHELPIKHGGSFHSFSYVYQRVNMTDVLGW